MKKNLSWKFLLSLGVIGIVMGRLMLNSVLGEIIGVFGDIMFLLGVVNLVSALIKKRKASKNIDS